MISLDVWIKYTNVTDRTNIMNELYIMLL